MSRTVVTKAQLAGALGKTAARVSQWIAEGAISGEAIVGEGRSAKIVLEIAKEQLRSRLDPAQSTIAGSPSPRTAPTIRTEDDARQAIALITRVLIDEGVVTDGPLDYAAARLADTILKAHERELRIAEAKKKLVPRAPMIEHIAKSVQAIKQTIQRMPARYAAEIAAELQVDPGRLTAALDRMIANTLTEMSAPVVR